MLTAKIFGAPKEEFSPEVLARKALSERISEITEKENDTENCHKIIRLMQFSVDPFNSNEKKAVWELIPAMDYLISNYGTEISPMILSYGLISENVYLKRRAILCLEKIEGTSFREYLFSQFGEDLKNEKLLFLSRESEKERTLTFYFPLYSERELKLMEKFENLREKN